MRWQTGPSRFAASPFKKVTECSQRLKTVADDLSNRQHGHRENPAQNTPVCTEDLNPDVVMVKSAQNGVRTYEAGSLNRTRDRRILVQ